MNAGLSPGFDDLSTAVVERVDQVCDRFEAEWKTERRPRIEDYLAGATGQERSALLRELLKLEVQLARCHGGAPTPRDYYATIPGDTALVDSVFREAAHREVGETASWPPADQGGPDPQGAAAPGGVAGVPQRIGKFVVLSELESGGQARVYRALDPDLGHEFVVKLARRPLQLDPEGAEQLRAEGRKLAQLDHPNLVRVVASDIHEGRPYLVLEYVAGRSLKQYVDQQRPSPWDAARLVAELAGAVAYLHGREIVHQDITPRNVLIDERGQPRLIDLGVARLRGAWGGDTGEGPVGGTRPYLLPEQAECADERIDPRTDVFGLGGVLYFLLTGHPLYESGAAAELRRLACTARVEPPRRINAAVPRALEWICLKALARLPEARYRSASEFGRALRRRLVARRTVPAIGIVSTVLLLTFWVLGRSSSWQETRSEGVDAKPTAATALAPQIVKLAITHLPKLSKAKYDRPRMGRLGERSFTTRLGDDLTVRAELSEPAYAYLIAFRPDGQIELCTPEDEAVAPEPARHLEYPPPAKSDEVYRLSDGVGLQAFAVVALHDPLPPFRAWKDRLKTVPWRAGEPGESGVVWRYDGTGLTPLTADDPSGTRSKGFKALGGGGPVGELANWLRNCPASTPWLSRLSPSWHFPARDQITWLRDRKSLFPSPNLSRRPFQGDLP